MWEGQKTFLGRLSSESPGKGFIKYVVNMHVAYIDVCSIYHIYIIYANLYVDYKVFWCVCVSICLYIALTALDLAL